MSKIIDKIITSSTAPNDTNVLWDDGKTLNIFRNGRWESTGLTSEQQDMIQKLLDAYGDLPEDLDTLKEIVDFIKSYSPNWNANEGEAGYIENRTHWYKDAPISIEIISDNKAIIKNANADVGTSFFKVKTIDYNFNPIYKIIDPRYNNSVISDADGFYNIQFFIEDERYVIIGNVNNLDSFDIKFISWDELHQLDDCFISDNIVRTADYERPHIKLSIVNSNHNLNILSHLTLSYRYVCDLYTSSDLMSYDGIWKIQNGELYNGVITGISEGKLVQYDVNFETGEITLKQTTDLELIASEIKLDVCTAGSTEAARNLELLNKAYFALGDHFTVNIDAGIGVAKFIPETGGEGHITTAEGVNVHYTIGADGSVIKIMEIDIVELYNKVEAITVTVDE